MKLRWRQWLQSNEFRIKQRFSRITQLKLPIFHPEAAPVSPADVAPVDRPGPPRVHQLIHPPVTRSKLPPSVLRLAIVGNCQVLDLPKCIHAITLGVVATCAEICRMAPTPEEVDLAPVLANNDILLVHPHHALQILIDAKYAHERDRIKTIPTIRFPAYHPDLVYIRGPGKGNFRGPLGEYHSSLAFYGWGRGMNVNQIMELFTEEVYQKLGFFDYWQSAKDALLNNAKMFDYPLEGLFDSWTRRGCFMHSVNHPKLFALADLARMALSRLGISTNPVAEQFIYDHFLGDAVWPVYPEIGRRLGIEGHYLFKKRRCDCLPDRPVVMLSLEEFVRESYASFSKYSKEDLVCDRLNSAPYKELENLIGMRPTPKPAAPVYQQKTAPEVVRRTPYDGLPDFHFWRKAVSGLSSHEVDPVVSAGFTIGRGMKVATAGSCFAQHISRYLRQNGFSYYIAEQPPEMPAEEAQRLNYGVFSARYGNIYTARQLLQLFDRAFGAFAPSESAWLRGDGRYADPFRPRIEPYGFAAAEAVEESRTAHLAAVREMFENLDVLVFTLGLTEAWVANSDGAVFPLAPGVSAGEMDFSLYEFVNFGAGEVTADLEAFVERLSQVNKRARIIFTVSPVPLVATFENRHVLLSTTYSKSVLRVAAEELVRNRSNCFYFPAYEIITGNYTRGAYYEDDLRSVNRNGVDHAMRLFFAHYSAEKENSVFYETLLLEAESLIDTICDEEAIDAADSASAR